MEDGNADGRRGVFAPWIVALGLEDRTPGAEHGRPLEEIQPGFWGLGEGYPGTEPR